MEDGGGQPMAEPKLHQQVGEVEEREKRDHKAPRWDGERRGQQRCWGHGGGVGWGTGPGRRNGGEKRRGGHGAGRGARERGRKRGVGARKLGCQVGLITSERRKNVGLGRNVLARRAGGNATVTGGAWRGNRGRSQDGCKGWTMVQRGKSKGWRTQRRRPGFNVVIGQGPEGLEGIFKKYKKLSQGPLRKKNCMAKKSCPPELYG